MVRLGCRAIRVSTRPNDRTPLLAPFGTMEYGRFATNPSRCPMFSRFVSMTLKPNAGQDFTNALERQVLPILRAQPGFRDQMIFVEPGSPELLAVSFWDSKEHSEKYGRAVFPDVLNLLSPFIEGSASVESYIVAYSTAHRIGLGTVPIESPNTTPVPGVGGG